MTETSNPWGNQATPYQEIGGEDGVRSLVEAFYDVIEAESPDLRSLLPANTTNTRRKFFMYLSGWLGGPPLYEQSTGTPDCACVISHSPSDNVRPTSGYVACG